jgi:negative regulator of sigma E activity
VGCKDHMPAYLYLEEILQINYLKAVVYFRDGMMRSNRDEHFIVDRDGIKQGERIDGKRTPLVSRL